MDPKCVMVFKQNIGITTPQDKGTRVKMTSVLTDVRSDPIANINLRALKIPVKRIASSTGSDMCAHDSVLPRQTVYCTQLWDSQIWQQLESSICKFNNFVKSLADAMSQEWQTTTRRELDLIKYIHTISVSPVNEILSTCKKLAIMMV
jgi:hypothetical protein